MRARPPPHLPLRVWIALALPFALLGFGAAGFKATGGPEWTWFDALYMTRHHAHHGRLRGDAPADEPRPGVHDRVPVRWGVPALLRGHGDDPGRGERATPDHPREGGREARTGRRPGPHRRLRARPHGPAHLPGVRPAEGTATSSSTATRTRWKSGSTASASRSTGDATEDASSAGPASSGPRCWSPSSRPTRTTCTSRSAPAFLNPNIFIVARAEHEASEAELRRVGANQVVSPYLDRRAPGRAGGAAADRRPLLDQASRLNAADYQIEESCVLKSSSLCGKTLREANLRDDLSVVVIALRTHDGEIVFNPKGDGRSDTGSVCHGRPAGAPRRIGKGRAAGGRGTPRALPWPARSASGFGLTRELAVGSGATVPTRLAVRVGHAGPPCRPRALAIVSSNSSLTVRVSR